MTTKSNSPKRKSKTVEPNIENVVQQNVTADEKSFVSVDNLTQLEEDLQYAWDSLMTDWQEQALSPAQRRQLLGSGVRRYGFLDKVSDLATTNTEFIPPYLNINNLKLKIRETEMLRNISALLQQMLRIVDDLLLINGDEAYRQALMYYNSVRDASRRRVPGALPLYRILETFFKRSRNKNEEPTEQKVIHDVRGLLHGTKEGEIVIKNTGKKVSKGKKIVIDETHKPEGEWKVTESGEIDE